MYSSDDFQDRVDLEYTLTEAEDLEEVLDQTNLNDRNKQGMRDVARNIVTAKMLVEQNPLATDQDRQFVKDTEDKYNQLKDEWRNE